MVQSVAMTARVPAPRMGEITMHSHLADLMDRSNTTGVKGEGEMPPFHCNCIHEMEDEGKANVSR